jgi:hypothetical protein
MCILAELLDGMPICQTRDNLALTDFCILQDFIFLHQLLHTHLQCGFRSWEICKTSFSKSVGSGKWLPRVFEVGQPTTMQSCEMRWTIGRPS